MGEGRLGERQSRRDDLSLEKGAAWWSLAPLGATLLRKPTPSGNRWSPRRKAAGHFRANASLFTT